MYQKFLPQGYAGIQVFSKQSIEKLIRVKSALEAGYVENHQFIIDSLDDAYVENHTLVIV